MSESLTFREREIFDALTVLIARDGYPPTVRELGEAVGLRSSSTVHLHLDSLDRKGYITRGRMKNRAIRVNPDQGPPA